MNSEKLILLFAKEILNAMGEPNSRANPYKIAQETEDTWQVLRPKTTPAAKAKKQHRKGKKRKTGSLIHLPG